MIQFPHLNNGARMALELSTDDRIAYLRAPRWIGYPIALHLIAKLEDLIVYPKSHRMPNLLIVGDTNNGKTMLIQRFCKNHLANANLEGEAIEVPVLYIQAPPVPDESRFYDQILEKVSATFKCTDRLGKKFSQVLTLLHGINIKMLVIDEIHHLLAGSLNKQRGFLNVIKFIGNDLQIPIVAIGTKDAYQALQTEPQLSNRFEPAPLPLWSFNSEYLRLLASFERMLPLKNPSILSDNKLANKIFMMTEGYIGEIAHLLVEASVLAVKSQDEAINSIILDEMDWNAPSDRKYKLAQ
jgi:type II secretory pathway predicted ATPase ExeA